MDRTASLTADAHGTGASPVGTESLNGTAAAERFEFRFVTRGEKAQLLVRLAIASLTRCHPRVRILVIDANDVMAPIGYDHPDPTRLEVVHVPPADDEIARLVGRGSRLHMFYWRRSPQLLAALPRSGRYIADADADLMFLRPMNLASLTGPLSRGRIAAAVDESTIEFFGRLRLTASRSGPALPSVGTGGPLLQAGLVFTNPDDDGSIFSRFWELAIAVARRGALDALPFDDMCLLTSLLGHGGPLWERLLPLGHEWNYITSQTQDPGAFGCVAHYGGHRAKAYLLAQPQSADQAALSCWGSVADRAAETRDGGTEGHRIGRRWISSGPGQDEPIPIPFALSWQVPTGVDDFTASIRVLTGPGSYFLLYLDGLLAQRQAAGDGRADFAIKLGEADVVTIIGVSDSANPNGFITTHFTYERHYRGRVS